MLHFAEEKPGDPEMGYLTGVSAFVAEQGLEPRPLDLSYREGCTPPSCLLGHVAKPSQRKKIIIIHFLQEYNIA